MSISKKLAEMDQAWKAGKDKGPGSVPAGIYAMQMQNCILREAQSSGNLQIRREHLILDGEYEGEVIWDGMSLHTDQGPYYVAKFIKQMGYDAPDSSKELPAILEKITADAPCYMGKVELNGDFTNVRIQEMLEVDEEAETDEDDPQPLIPEEDEEETDEDEEVEYEAEFDIGSAVEFDTDDDEMVGTICEVDLEGGTADVEVEDGDVYTVYIADLRPAAVVEEEETKEDEDEDSSEDLEMILSIAEAYGLEIDGDKEDFQLETVVETLKDYEFDSADLTDVEVAVLEKYEIPIAKKAPNKPKKIKK